MALVLSAETEKEMVWAQEKENAHKITAAKRMMGATEKGMNEN
jgi:hypothetical protein